MSKERWSTSAEKTAEACRRVGDAGGEGGPSDASGVRVQQDREGV